MSCAAHSVYPTKKEPRSPGKEAEPEDNDHVSDDGAMYRLEHTSAHRDLCCLVESRIDQILASDGYTSRDVFEAMKGVEYMGEGSAAWARDASREIFTLLNEVSDFELWARGMRGKARARQLELEREATRQRSSLRK